MSTVKKVKTSTVSKNGKSNSKDSLNYKELKRAAMVLRAVNHPLRQKMLELIEKEKNIHVTKIYVKLRLEQSVASQHLAILRSAGFVSTNRDGKFIFYTINNNRVSQISGLIKEINN